MLETTAYAYREESFKSDTHVVTANEASLMQLLSDCAKDVTATVLDAARDKFWREHLSHVSYGDVGDVVDHCVWACRGSDPGRKRKAASSTSLYATTSREKLTRDRMVVYTKITSGQPLFPILHCSALTRPHATPFSQHYLHRVLEWLSRDLNSVLPLASRHARRVVLQS
jgi:hypothetical protein